jgi:acetate---CoA ligase (ADP-forming)
MTIKKNNISALIQPQSVAVVGASSRPESYGNIVLGNFQNSDFSGKLYLVNPKYQEINGIPCFPNLSELPESVDCAILCVPARATIPILEELGGSGGKSAVIFASGFAESDQSGGQLQGKLIEIAKKHNLAICGPNCMGLVNFQSHFLGYSAPKMIDSKPGRVASISQSGSVSIAFQDNGLGIDLGCAISSGNEAVTTIEDYLDYFVDDPQTDVIMAFVESFKDISKLRAVAEKALSCKKPILVMKIGRSLIGQRTVKAHTGALAGSDAVHDAFFRQYGIIRVDTLDEMFVTASIFLQAKQPHGDQIGLMAFSGGEAGLLADFAEINKINFAPLSQSTETKLRAVLPDYINIDNPLDTGWISVDMYESSLEILAQEPHIDLVVVNLDSHSGLRREQAETYENFTKSVARVSKKADKPFVMLSSVSGGFHPIIQSALAGSQVPMLQGTKEGLLAIRHFMNYSLFDREKPPTAAVREGHKEHIQSLRKMFDTACLSEHSAKKVLAAYGVPVTREILVDSVDEARQAAETIGYPIALKVDSPDIQHKTEIGAVCLNVRDESSLNEVFESLLNKAVKAYPEACINGVLVQEMLQADDAVEIIVGVTTDPQFGKVILLGLGGILVEVLRDVSMRLVPLSEQDAWAMLDDLSAAKILKEGVRGKPAADCRAIVDVLLKVSQLTCDLEEQISEIDINPLFVFPEGQGVKAADALIITTIED